MTAAKTVSRAGEATSCPPATIRVTISPTSMVVTATARTRGPRLADPVRDDLGMVDGSEHRADQEAAGHDVRHDLGGSSGVAPPGEQEGAGSAMGRASRRERGHRLHSP